MLWGTKPVVDFQNGVLDSVCMEQKKYDFTFNCESFA